MARYKFLFICLVNFFVCRNFTQAQNNSLSGVIIDGENNSKLVGAVIKWGSQTAVSENNGVFFIKQNPSQESPAFFTVSYIGYETKKVEINNTQLPIGSNQKEIGVTGFHIKLYPDNKLLNMTLVTAGRFEQSVKRMMVSTEVIKPYLFQNKNATNMDKFLDQIPSVNVIDGQVNIRSGSGWTYGVGSRVMVLLDDMPFLTGDAGQVKWNFVPVENVEQVEVVKGASSVLYGSSALSGILHFRTELAKNKPITRISAFTGAYSDPERSNLLWSKSILKQSGTSAFHSFKYKKTQWAFSGNYLRDEGYRMGDNDNRLRLNSHLKYTLNNQIQMGINMGALVSDGGSFLLWESYQKGYTILDSQVTNTFSKNLYVDPYISYHTGNFKHQLRGRFMYISNDISNPDPNINQDNFSKNMYGEYQVQRYVSKFKMNISSGLVSSMNSSNSPLYSGLQKSRNHAVFLQLDQALGKRVNWCAGARYEYFNMNGREESKPVFRAGINVEMTHSSFMRASFGQGYRFPSIAEKYIQTSVGLLNIFPNPDLKSETGWNAEIGLKQGFSLLGMKGFMDVAYFYTRYQNMIDFNLGVWKPIVDPFNPFPSLGFKSLNIGETQISGLDLSFNAEGNIGKVKVQTIFGYTYTNPIMLHLDQNYAMDELGNSYNYRSTRSDSSNILKYRFRHLFKWDIQTTYLRWQMGVSYRYNSAIQNIDAAFVGIPLTAFITGISDARLANKNGNSVVDLRFAYQINSHLRIAIVSSNLFNAEIMTRPADLRPPRLTIVQLNFTY